MYVQRADSEDVSPPPIVGMAPDDVYAKVGAANDLVVVKKPDGGLTISDFHVRGAKETGVSLRRTKYSLPPPPSPSGLWLLATRAAAAFTVAAAAAERRLVSLTNNQAGFYCVCFDPAIFFLLLG